MPLNEQSYARINFEGPIHFLGARAPLGLAPVKKKKKKKLKEKDSNSNNLLYPASTSTLLLAA